MNYFIYGVPGVGKTYYAKGLSKQLNLIVIEGDRLKKQVGKSGLTTCKAFKQFGELNQKNAIKGLLLVRKELASVVEEKIKNQTDYLLEAAFLDPLKISRWGRAILLTVTDEKQHWRQFLHHREKLFDWRKQEFKAARMIQDYLIVEAKKIGIEIVNNNGKVKA